MKEQKYLYPTHEAGKRLFLKNIQGTITNLNLIRLKDIADYTDFPEIAPPHPISGYQAFMNYIVLAEPFVHNSGGRIIYLGKGDHYLIGPEKEYWDICMLIEQKSVQDFFAFEQNTDYLKIMGHRLAAIDDARLLPLESIVPNF